MAFRVGQKVVCVDASPIWSDGRVLLTLNAIYEISEVSPSLNFLVGKNQWQTASGIRVAEVPLSRGEWLNPRRFRPVVERETDISIFTKMLTPKIKERT